MFSIRNVSQRLNLSQTNQFTGAQPQTSSMQHLSPDGDLHSAVNTIKTKYPDAKPNFPGLANLHEVMQDAPPFGKNQAVAFLYMKAVVCGHEANKNFINRKLKEGHVIGKTAFNIMNKEINQHSDLDCAQDGSISRQAWDDVIHPILTKMSKTATQPKFVPSHNGMSSKLNAVQTQPSTSSTQPHSLVLNLHPAQNTQQTSNPATQPKFTPVQNAASSVFNTAQVQHSTDSTQPYNPDAVLHSVAETVQINYPSAKANFPGLATLNQAMQSAPPFGNNQALAFLYMKAVVCGNRKVKERLDRKLNAGDKIGKTKYDEMNQKVNKESDLHCAKDGSVSRQAWDNVIRPILSEMSVAATQPQLPPSQTSTSSPTSSVSSTGQKQSSPVMHHISSSLVGSNDVDSAYEHFKDKIFFTGPWKTALKRTEWDRIKRTLHNNLSNQPNGIDAAYQNIKDVFFKSSLPTQVKRAEWNRIKMSVYDILENSPANKASQPRRFQNVAVNVAALNPAQAAALGFSNPDGQPPRSTEISSDLRAWRIPLKGVSALSQTLSEIYARNKKTGQYEIHTCFYQPASPFSNWNHSPFLGTDGQSYNCMEQYLFAEKYRRCGRPDIAEEIMRAPTAAEQKRLNTQYGPEVASALPQYWFGQGQREALKQGLYDSFIEPRNEEKLAALLLSKGPLIEAAADDPIYGAKAGLFDKHSGVVDQGGVEAIRNGTWTGQNLLGEALTELREKIKSKHATYAQGLQQRYESKYKPDNFN